MRGPARIFLAAWILAASTAGATDFLSTNRYTLPAGSVLSNELWMQAQTIVMAGTAKDDLFLLAAGNGSVTGDAPALLLSGVMGGDVWAAGESIALSGLASRHARVAGFKSVHLDGEVGRNLIAVGSTVLMEKQAVVNGTAMLVGQDVLLDGAIRGKTRVYGNRVTVGGTFDDDLSITASDINLRPGTCIAGNLTYTMDKELVLDNRVTVKGKVVKTEPVVGKPRSGLTLNTVLFQAGLCCAAIVVGLAFVTFFPSTVVMSARKLTESFWRCLLVGFIAFCLIPMAAFFLIFTLIGLPLALMLVLAYLIMIYVAKVISGIYLGNLILRGYLQRPNASVLPPLAAGLLLMYAAACLPFPVDILVWFSFTLLGLGALAGAILDKRTPVFIASPPSPGAPGSSSPETGSTAP